MLKVGNDTKDIVFTVLCFSDKKEVEIPRSIVFLIIFLIIIIGNITVFVTITLCSQLHNPMYMFLGSLSFLDISYALTTLPQLLLMFSTQDKTISFMSFCLSHNIEYLFCDYAPVLKITCSDTSAIEILM
ncbi:hypothetical protein XELAEV_18034377mg [Xenopus laevis]|uniref:G-protein coupled receptors family 1 profile domain-containing protein n=1 Tax=Xenopus laevis TaxID=8355 RepID=A0A974CEE2_XENLA|nr:hypothetical protein XELAEV_18034377mg [Xenopus laevis]